MSVFREDILSDLQEMLTWPLLVDAYFADIPVLDYRKDNIASEIEKILSTTQGKGGKIGAAVIVLPLAANPEFLEAGQTAPLKVTATYRVLENPLYNLGVNGTGKRARSIAYRIRHVLQDYIFGGYASGLVPDREQFIIPVEDPIAPEAYEVNFTCLEHADQNFFKCGNVVPSYDTETGILSLSCPDTNDVTIYYTTDGSYPHPLNTGHDVQTYTGPITIQGEQLILAAAFREDHAPGNVGAWRFNIIGGQEGSIS